MTGERWRRIEEIYQAALDRPEALRPAYLDGACGEDSELRNEVESLLAHCADAKSFLESRSPQSTLTMALHQHIGPYRILGPIGAGGMGEVYRAHDSKLGRDVALKTLPREFALDASRLARFRREARTLASLNHPNIAAIYGLEESDGAMHLVLELVEGETLSGPMPIDKVLECGLQVAEGLEAAHEKGIIHRDLKPANIKVTPKGRVKILDFGLAKAVWALDNQDLSRIAPVETADNLQTVVGQVLGTPAYMSPEQARGMQVDQRADIWAFGCLLYELLTGKRAFEGATVPETIEGVLERQPDWGALPTKTPGIIRELMRQCMKKDPSGRLAEIADARRIMTRALRRSNRWVAAGLTVGALAAAALGGVIWFRASSPLSDSSKWVQLTRLPDSVNQPALSPDGRMLAFLRGSNTFIGESELYAKLLPDGEPVQLTHDKTRKMSPAFSPDGSRIAYTALGQNGGWDTWTVPALGGTPELWLPNAAALTWADPQHILFSQIKSGSHMGIATERISQTERRDVYLPSHEFGMAHRSYLSPDRRWVLIVEMNEVPLWMPCRLVPYDGSSPGRQVGPPGTCTTAAWSPDGRWMFFSAAAPNGQYHIWRQRFPNGKPEQITSGPTQEEGIAISSDGRSLITAVAVRQRPVWYHDNSGDHEISVEGYGSTPRLDYAAGKLYYRVNKSQAATRGGGELDVTDLSSGRSEPVVPGFDVLAFNISRDGRLVLTARDSEGKPRFWVGPLNKRAALHQIPRIESTSTWAQLKPSGGLFFLATQGHDQFIFEVHEDGSALRQVSAEAIQQLDSISPDGEWVTGIGTTPNQEVNQTVFAYSTTGQYRVPICGPPCNSYFAPDGRFLYISIPEGWMNAAATGHTYALPIPPGSALPKLPSGGFKSEVEIAAVPGVRVIDAADIGPGPSPEIYAFSREIAQRNLFRIPLR
jgi:serine/threonine protein kinase